MLHDRLHCRCSVRDPAVAAESWVDLSRVGRHHHLIHETKMILAVELIPAWRLAVAFIPVVGVLTVLWAWNQPIRTSVYALARMLAQLLIVGYVLLSIFKTDWSLIVLAVLFVMAMTASWISLRTVPEQRGQLFVRAFTSVALAGGLTLAIITQLVLVLDPWYSPRFLIPLAGMIFSSCMNTVSLAAERFNADLNDGKPREEARATAMQTALIPITNSLFAVGLVSFPGMMTGQVLSGESPLVAARYQIMVMCMTFGASGLAAALYLSLAGRETSAAA